MTPSSGDIPHGAAAEQAGGPPRAGPDAAPGGPRGAAGGDLLRDGIARNAAAVLCLPSAGMLRHHSTRFLGEGEDGFYVEAPAGERALLDRLIADGTPVGIAFKAAQRKIVFTSPIRERHEHFAVNDRLAVEALRLRFPDDIRPVQRRAHYRVTVPAEQSGPRALGLRAWRIAEHAVLRDRPMAALEIPARVRDLSLGGVGFVCLLKPPPKGGKEQGEDEAWAVRDLRHDLTYDLAREAAGERREGRELPKLLENERLRLSLSFGDEELLLEGRVRHFRRLPDGSLAGGAQFKKLEKDLEGRQYLSRLTGIVGELQRDEIRRRRGTAG